MTAATLDGRASNRRPSARLGCAHWLSPSWSRCMPPRSRSLLAPKPPEPPGEVIVDIQPKLRPRESGAAEPKSQSSGAKSADGRRRRRLKPRAAPVEPPPPPSPPPPSAGTTAAAGRRAAATVENLRRLPPNLRRRRRNAPASAGADRARAATASAASEGGRAAAQAGAPAVRPKPRRDRRAAAAAPAQKSASARAAARPRGVDGRASSAASAASLSGYIGDERRDPQPALLSACRARPGSEGRCRCYLRHRRVWRGDFIRDHPFFRR